MERDSTLDRKGRRLAELQVAIVAVSLTVGAVASVAAANAIQMERLRAGFGPLARVNHTPTDATASLDLRDSE